MSAPINAHDADAALTEASPPTLPKRGSVQDPRRTSRANNEQFAESLLQSLVMAQSALKNSHDRIMEMVHNHAHFTHCLEVEALGLSEENEQLRETLGITKEKQPAEGDLLPRWGHPARLPAERSSISTVESPKVRASVRIEDESTGNGRDADSFQDSEILLPGVLQDEASISMSKIVKGPLKGPSVRTHNSQNSSTNSAACVSEARTDEDVKRVIRSVISTTKPCLTTKNFYKESSIWSAIAMHPSFEKITLGIVTLNAIWVGVDTDWNDAAFLFDAHWVFIVAENFWCTAFLTEWVIRFLAFELKANILKDNWYMFDTVLVVIIVIETWMVPVIVVAANAGSSDGAGHGAGNASVLRLARLLRLSRMARVAKLLRAMPELVIMIKALKAATRSVFFTLILLGMLLYVFGITFKQMCENSEIGKELFDSVLQSMYSLLLYGVLCLDFLDVISEKLVKVGFYMPFFLFVFVLLSALTVMNMLIGVLCEVVNNVAKQENEYNLIETTRTKVQEVLASIDEDGNQMISKDEFLHILEHHKACRAFHDVGIDVVGMVDFANTIFWDPLSQREEELSFEEFMERVLKLRGTNQATVKDILHLAKIIHTSDARVVEMQEILNSEYARTPQTPASPLPSKLRLAQKSRPSSSLSITPSPRHFELNYQEV